MTVTLRAVPLAFLLSTVAGTASADLGEVPAGRYSVDPLHGYIDFGYNHLGLSNPSLSFDDFTMDLDLDNEDPTQSKIDITIDATSVVAGSDTWREHLSGEDFFHFEAYPEITFTSTSIEANGDNSYIVNGDITLKGETRPTSFTVTINAAMNHPMTGQPVIGIAADGMLVRSEFGMGKYAPAISDEVEIDISAELVKAD